MFGELPEVVRSVQMGLIVPPADKVALAEAITELALSPRLRKRFSINAKRAMNATYSVEAISQQITLIYRAFLERHQRTWKSAESPQ